MRVKVRDHKTMVERRDGCCGIDAGVQEEDERNQEARRRLLDEVLVTREAQIQEKMELSALAAQERAYEREKLKSEMDRIAKQEEEYTHMVRMVSCRLLSLLVCV